MICGLVGLTGLLFTFIKMKRNMKKERKVILEEQEKQFRDIAKYAFEHSPYYKEKYELAGITSENIQSVAVEKIPTLNKKEFMEHFNEIVTDDSISIEKIREFDQSEKDYHKMFLEKYHVVHSSGSTGKPGFFIYDKKAWITMLVGIVRGVLWDYSLGQVIKLLISGPRIVFLAATDGRYGGAMAVTSGIEGVKAKQLSLDIKSPLNEWKEKIEKFRPTIIIGYPSAIKILGELVNDGSVILDVERVISCGEPMNNRVRNYLENQFNATVVNFYGASESLALGVELDSEEGMYLFDDLNYIEMIDGHMYLTCLYNKIAPIIRYRLSDQLDLKQQKKLQYPYTLTDIVLGREEDVLWFENEAGQKDFIHPLAVEGFCIEGLLDYQFRQESFTSFKILIETARNYSSEEVKKELAKDVAEILKEKNLNYVSFEIEVIDSIPFDNRTGKKSLIITLENR